MCPVQSVNAAFDYLAKNHRKRQAAKLRRQALIREFFHVLIVFALSGLVCVILYFLIMN